MEIPEWIIKAEFQCDVTKEYSKFNDLFVAWYDKIVENNGIKEWHSERFMLVKQGEFHKIKDIDKEWMLNSRPLKRVLSENVSLFFTEFLITYSNHKLEKKTDICSWNELFRRLTVPYYEIARHRLSEARSMDYFSELTEFQLLQTEQLKKFLDVLK